MISYREGYKYQLVAPYSTLTKVKPGHQVRHEGIVLETSGALFVPKWYAWDGPSGPAIDTKNFMRGSLVHDVFYQLMRVGWLPHAWRKAADEELVRICKEDGMSAIRAWWVYQGVRFAAGPAIEAESIKPILIAGRD